MKIPKPIRDRVVLEQLSANKETTTQSGIILPASKNGDDIILGRVVALGLGAITENGVRVKPELKLGDIVAFKESMEEELVVGGKSYLVIFEAEVVAIMPEDA